MASGAHEEGDGAVRWMMLTGDRRLVAAVLLCALCLSLVPVALLLPVDVEHLLIDPDDSRFDTFEMGRRPWSTTTLDSSTNSASDGSRAGRSWTRRPRRRSTT